MILFKITFDNSEKKKKTKKVYKKKIMHYIDTNTGKEHSYATYPNGLSISAINMYPYGKIYSNKKEAALFLEHRCLGKEYGLKLRQKRSNHKLASPWEEEPSSSWDKTKSWKDNSKRKKQYYKK